VFTREARRRGFDAVVTGHYARVVRDELNDDTVALPLRRARDLERDQSYFLCGIDGRALRHVYFPIAHLTKTTLREIASLVPELSDVATRRSSRGLCFVGKRDFGDFVTQFIEKRPATIVDYDTGKVLAQKDNIYAFTVGQRAQVSGLPTRYYVVEKRAATNEVLVSANPAVLTESECIVEDFHWITGAPPAELRAGRPWRAREQARSLAKPAAPCTVEALNDECTILRVKRDIGALLFSPGQFVALYDEADDVCHGGGPVAVKQPKQRQEKQF
jgi:tRNA U34 2-thiouridine synthase MnmA/TrmU